MNFLASATIIVEIPHSISFKWDPNQDYYPSFLQSEKKTITKTRPKFLQNMDDFPRFERVIIKRCAFFSGDKSVELFFYDTTPAFSAI